MSGTEDGSPDPASAAEQVASLLSRRELLLAGATGAASYTAGQYSPSIPGLSVGSPGSTDSPVADPSNREDNWMAQHREVLTDKPKDRGRRRYVLTANTTLQFLGASWEQFGNPDSDSDVRGAWQYTFMLNSTAAFLVPERINAGPISTNRFHAWPSERGTDWVPADSLNGEYEASSGDPSATQIEQAMRTFKLGDTMEVRSIGQNEENEAGRNVAVAARRDADMFGFTNYDQARQYYIDNPELANAYGLYNPDDVANANVAKLLAKERRANQDATITVALTAASITAGLVSAPVGIGISVIGAMSAIGELLDSADLKQLEAYRGFKQHRDPAGSVAGHELMFDIYCGPGATGRFAIRSAHPASYGTLANLRYPDDVGTEWTFEIDAPSEPADRASPSVRPDPPTLVADESTFRPSDRGGPGTPKPGIHVPVGPHRTDETIPIDAYDTARATAPIESYEWSVEKQVTGIGAPGDDGPKTVWEGTDHSGTGVEYPLTVKEPGTYRLRLNVTDADGRTGTTHERILVMGDPDPAPRIVAGKRAVQPEEDVTLEAVNDNDEVTVERWRWVFPDSKFDQPERTGASITESFPYPSAGRSYTIVLEATAENGNAASTSLVLPVMPEPKLRVYAEVDGERRDEIQVDPGDTVMAKAEINEQFDISQYNWSATGGRDAQQQIEDGNEDTLDPHRFLFPEAGEYTIRLWVSDVTGASATDTVLVTVGQGSQSSGDALFSDDWEDGTYQSNPTWQFPSSFDNTVEVIDRESPDGGMKAVRLTDATDSAINLSSERFGESSDWSDGWRIEGLFYTTDIPGAAPEDPTCTYHDVKIGVGRSVFFIVSAYDPYDEAFEPIRIEGNQIEEGETASGGIKQGEWYRYELRYDGNGAYSATRWVADGAKSDGVSVTATGRAPDGPNAILLYASGNSEGGLCQESSPTVVDHAFVEMAPTGEGD